MEIADFFKQRLMPAVTFTSEAQVLPVTEAMIQGGLDVMEITFRSNVAVKAIEMVRKHFPKMMVGAGTLLTPQQVEEATAAGAMFGVAPGLNLTVVKAAANKNFPFIPGVTTASEVENALANNCQVLKLFPCNLAGGTALIKALQEPYKHTGVKFIPMGGINLTNLHTYLSFESVLAMGGSWIASKELITTKNYQTIKENAQKSIAIINQSF